MQDLTVGVLQYPIHWQSPKENHAHIRNLLEDTEDLDLLILPETFNSGFTNNTSLAHAMDGESVEFLSELSQERKCVVLASLLISENEQTFNRCVVCANGKILTWYDKIHLFSLSDEDKHFTAGSSVKEFDCKGWKVRPLICYDLRFPEISRNTTGYDLLIYVANWPKKRVSHWSSLLPARAIENQSYVIGCNRIGTDENGIEYSGNSTFIDAKGEILLDAQSEPGLFVKKLSKESMMVWRNQLSALRDQKLS